MSRLARRAPMGAGGGTGQRDRQPARQTDRRTKKKERKREKEKERKGERDKERKIHIKTERHEERRKWETMKEGKTKQ